MDTATLASGAAAAALAGIHWMARRFEEALNVVPRSRWLSIGGGVSVAYVFVHLLPEIAASQADLEEHGALSGAAAHELWLGALAGLIVFYGLERLTDERARRAGRGGADPVGWLHLSSYALYNAIAGYLLVEQAEDGLGTLALYATAIGVHFLVNDHGLVEKHGPLYRASGRWLLAAAVVAGWAVSGAAAVGPLPVALLLAFLGGGIVLNVLKEELPPQRRSRFSTFAAAAVGYSALLVVT